MSVGKSLARGTVNTIGSVFGIAGALVGVVGDFAEGLVSETSKAVDGELLPRNEESEILTKMNLLLAGISAVQGAQEKAEKEMLVVREAQKKADEKFLELIARIEALEKR